MKHKALFTLGAVTATAIGAILYLGWRRMNSCAVRVSEGAPIDGGSITAFPRDVSDGVSSGEAVSFDSELSFIGMSDGTAFDGNVYTLHASLKDDRVFGRISRRDRFGDSDEQSFVSDDAFMKALSRLIEAHGIEKLNGYYHKTNALPDMYGTSIDISYASGQHISAYDNESGFLTEKAMTDIVNLFYTQIN